MRALLALPLIVFVTLWLHQLGANLQSSLGALVLIPDMLAIGLVYALLRLPPRAAVAFALAAGLLADVSTGVRFGAFAAQGAFLMALLLPVRRSFFQDQAAGPCFFLGFAFLVMRELGAAAVIAPRTLAQDIPVWLPRMLVVNVATAVAAVLLIPAGDLVSGRSANRGARPRRL